MNDSIAQNSFKFDNELRKFEVVLKVDYFASVNSMYGINRRTGAVYLQPEAAHTKNQIKDQLTWIDPVKQCPWITPDATYSIEYNFVIKSEFWKRDLDNMIKLSQDAVFECLRVNDSHVLDIKGSKSLRSGEFEYLILKIRHSEHDYMSLSR